MSKTRGIVAGIGVLALTGGVALGMYGMAGETPRTTSSAAPAAHTAVQPAPQEQSVSAAATITRSKVLARARTWHPHTARRVPYSQSKKHGGYRTDCSGYASMALALPKPGPNTVGLAARSVSRRIPMSQLKPGDLVIDASGNNHTRHVVIFVKWANSKHTAYWEYEQRGGYGTDYRTRSYGLSAGSEYHAYRPNKIR